MLYPLRRSRQDLVLHVIGVAGVLWVGGVRLSGLEMWLENEFRRFTVAQILLSRTPCLILDQDQTRADVVLILANLGINHAAS